VVAWWTVTLPDPDPEVVAAVRADPAVEVVDLAGGVALHPAAGPGDTAVVFYPGGGVAPESYLGTWAPIVAQTGISVHIPAMPLRLAVLAPGRAQRVVAANPAVTSWWIGGHSLGGAMAAGHLAGTPPGAYAGAILFAAYPAGDGLAARDDLRVLSVVGTRDGLSTVEDVEARRELLPADAEVVVLDGVNHAQFGAYGDQSGDLPPQVDDADATTAIAAAVTAFLAHP
jgi:hypothetical protein